MSLGRTWSTGLAVSIGLTVALAGCERRRPAQTHPAKPTVEFNRARVPLGSALEVTYTWQVGASAKKLNKDYRVLVHFLDSHKVMLFGDDHLPIPAASEWEAGKTHSYTRTLFVPIYPYVGQAEVRMGLYSATGKGERLAIEGEDVGLNEVKVGSIELLPQTDNIFVVEKEGWHTPETLPDNPALERTWTRKEAVVSFKNPKQDIILYLEADTNYKAFAKPPVLTLSVGDGAAGLRVPIESSETFLKKVRFTAALLGDKEWVDLKLSMSEGFVPKAQGMNTDERELGLLVYHLYVGSAAELGEVSGVEPAVVFAE